MTRAIHKLSNTKIKAGKLKPGLHSDGGNLYLKVGASGSKSWIVRYSFDSKTHDLGIGSIEHVSLEAARKKAASLRKQIADGINPKTAKEAASKPSKTWGDYVDSYIDAHRPEWTMKQADIWEQSLRDYGPDRALPLSAITTAVVTDALRVNWTKRNTTAKKVQSRIESVWASAKVEGLVSGDNPAQWKGHLDKLLPKPSKTYKPKHFPAMPYADIPAFMAELGTRTDIRAQALRLTILTAVRTKEALGFDWSEDEGDVWRIPADRMKAGREHLVPLSVQVRELLDNAPRDAMPFVLPTNHMLFYLQKTDMGGMGLPQYTVHGFRSVFSDWAHEQTDFPSHVIEMALAHTIKSKTEAAYRRGSLLEKRRELMQAWADYCLPAYAA